MLYDLERCSSCLSVQHSMLRYGHFHRCVCWYTCCWSWQCWLKQLYELLLVFESLQLQV